MMVKGSTSRIRVNASEENDTSALVHECTQPEDFDLSSHSSALIEGMNQLRSKDHLLDVKLWAEGRCFKVGLTI